MSIVQSTILMSDYEEDLSDCPTFSTENRPAESMFGAYRAESTDQWTAANGITMKIPPRFRGPTSWFKYEELIDDWILQCLKSRKTRTSTEEQTCRRCRNAQRTSQSRISESRRWSQVFQGYVATQFQKRAQSVCLLGFYPFFRARRGDIEMVKWIGKFSLLLKRQRDAWMDMLPMTIVASDLSEFHRERLTSSLSLKGMNVTANTVETAKTVFVELF